MAGSREHEAWLAGQNAAFLAAINEAPLEETLGLLVRSIGERIPEARAAFYVLYPDARALRHVAGMSDDYAASVDRFVVSEDSLACGLAVHIGRPVITPDVRLDPRCKDWLWLAERHDYRASWSFPVEMTGGDVVGALSFYFREPRDAGPDDLEFADSVTRTAAIIISRHQQAERRAEIEAELRRREADLARVQRIGQVGGLNIAVAEGLRSIRSPEYLRLHGLPPTTREESHEQWRARVHADDRDRAEQALFTALASAGESYDCEYRIIRPSDGEVRWIHARADIERDADGKPLRLVGAHLDVTEQKGLQQTLRESEERQAFLLKFSDALRTLADPVEIQKTAMTLLGEHMALGRAAYFEVEADGDSFSPAAGFAVGLPDLPERMRTSDFGADIREAYNAGRTFIVEDTEALPLEEQRAAHRAIGVRSWVGVPLAKEGRLIVILGVHRAVAHRWTANELNLLQEVAERTWASAERARAEAALKQSEARFQEFAEASSAGLWIRDAASLDMEYASPSIARIYGVRPGALLGDVKRWAATVVPDDRALALEHMDHAREGRAVVHEFRIQRASDQAFRWIRNTDFPLRDEAGEVRRIGGIAEDVTETRLAVEHQAVLLAELQHRVRNIMAMIQSIAARSAKGAGNVSEYAELMTGRLFTMARVQALLTRAANVGVDVGALVRDELEAQAHHADQFEIVGPEVILAPKAAEVLTLAVHELATNALKHGGLSTAGGRVKVAWRVEERTRGPWLSFDWNEEGAPLRPPSPEPLRRGFGSELIEARVPYELGGRSAVVITADGAQCHLEFPLKGGASILETDAPPQATVFGGALDMTGEADLSGHRILVVEDDYFLAADTVSALRSAGAEVLGPCGTIDDALAELADAEPTGAVVDINLGQGPSFKVARALRKRGVPMVFVTGYDHGVIPTEFDGVDRLDKPVELKRVVACLARALGATQ